MWVWLQHRVKIALRILDVDSIPRVWSAYPSHAPLQPLPDADVVHQPASPPSTGRKCGPALCSLTCVQLLA